MMSESRSEFERLLMSQALDDLDPQEMRRLEELRSEFPEFDVEEWELLVGEVTAASLSADGESMPTDLKSRLLEEGRAWLAEERKAHVRLVPDPTPESGPELSKSKSRFVAAWSGWVAAAAMAALWLGGLGQAVEPSEPGAAAMRTTLTQTQEDAVEIPWETTNDPAAAGTSGDLVWSTDAQSGVMRFVGLEANDPQQLRYQLWIFDEARETRYPIDGGLFDVAPGAAEVLVPVDARLRVLDPGLFAVTVETSDGVVVSDRSRIVVLAHMPDLSQAQRPTVPQSQPWAAWQTALASR